MKKRPLNENAKEEDASSSSDSSSSSSKKKKSKKSKKDKKAKKEKKKTAKAKEQSKIEKNASRVASKEAAAKAKLANDFKDKVAALNSDFKKLSDSASFLRMNLDAQMSFRKYSEQASELEHDLCRVLAGHTSAVIRHCSDAKSLKTFLADMKRRHDTYGQIMTMSSRLV